MTTNLRVLLFADDLALFAESPSALQHSLHLLYQYCQKWALKINIPKSKVMFFQGQKNSSMNISFVLVTSGTTIANGSLKQATSTLSEQGSHCFC